MDVLAHGLYGVTVCSRKGLAGGSTGFRGGWWRDRTVWWAFAFGIAPDLISMWVPFAVHVLTGDADGVIGGFFQHFGGGWLVLYRVVHSLVASLAVAGLLWFARRSLFIPSLAWSVHLLMDAVSHGDGKFRTVLFYPLSEWAFDGIRWWREPWLVRAYWAVLPATWLVLFLWRRGRRMGNN